VLVVNETVFVSSFLGDAVLQTPLPLNEASTFEVFAHGSYCAKPSLRCGILNGPWGLAYARGLLYVSSFGSDQVLVFEASSGRFLDALGDSDSLDSPEGIAVSDDGSELFVASFLDSRIVAFDIAPHMYSPSSMGHGPASQSGRPSFRTVARGRPVDLDYLISEEEVDSSGDTSWRGGDPSRPLGRRHLEQLHGPEGLAVLGSSGLLAVSSYYNNSVLLLDPETGALKAALEAPNTLGMPGPMGLAYSPGPCDAQDGLGAGLGAGSGSEQGRGCLLVAAYKSKGNSKEARGLVARFELTGRAPKESPKESPKEMGSAGGWRYAGPAYSSAKLAGPVAVALVEGTRGRSALVAVKPYHTAFRFLPLLWIHPRLVTSPSNCARCCCCWSTRPTTVRPSWSSTPRRWLRSEACSRRL